MASEYTALGPGTRFWALEKRVPWNADFWLYMAVGSFVVVPFFEELFTRGYLLGRVRESFSPGGSLLIMAVFFAFAHGQYRHLDALAAGSLVSILVWAAILGYSVYRTGSLVPAIVAHAMINVPMNVSVRWVVLGVSLVAAWLWRRAIGAWLIGFLGTIRQTGNWLATLMAIGAVVSILVTISRTSWAPVAWLTVLGLLSIPGLWHRSPWKKAAEVTPSAPAG